MSKNETTAPDTVPRQTMVVTEGVTTVIDTNQPAAPEPQEKENAQNPRRPARES